MKIPKISTVLLVLQRCRVRRCVFLHIQKTAGTSIVEHARRVYGEDKVMSHGDYLSSDYYSADDHGALHPDRLAKLNRCPFVSGHFGFGYAEALIRTRYSFTFLRDPVERLLSYYYFCRKSDPQEYWIYGMAQRLSLHEFLSLHSEDIALQSCTWNNQAWQIANGYGYLNGRSIKDYTPEALLRLAVDNLALFGHVGLTETFAEDHDHIFRALGLASRFRPMVFNSNPCRPRSADLPTDTQKLLMKMTELDRELYAIARQERERRMSRQVFA